MFTLPNVLSLTRFPIGACVALAACHHAWGLAFGLLLLGCLTDLADGYIAKRWNMGSVFGADVLEPVCDLALTTGAIVGLVLTHRLPLWTVIVMVVIAGVVQVINSFMVETRLFTHFGQWFMPIYFRDLDHAGVVRATRTPYGTVPRLPQPPDPRNGSPGRCQAPPFHRLVRTGSRS